MLRRLLVASVCTSVLAVGAPATASPEDRASVPVQAVRQYGDGPVAVKSGQELVLRFKGKRGDRVSLGVAYRLRSGKPYYGTVDERDVSVEGRGSQPEPDSAGYFRLAKSGWFSVHYLSDANQHIQLFKQVQVTHAGRGTTRLPKRRGYQYAVRVRAPRSGLRVVSFGAEMFGVVSKGRYAHSVGGQALVVAPGLPVLGDDPNYALTKALAPRQQVLALVDPSSSGRVTTSVPTTVGRVRLDGDSVALPAGGTQAVVAELAAADLAASAQRLLNVRIPDALVTRDWSVVVLPAGGGVAEPSAAAYGLYGPDAASLYQLAATTGTYRVLAFPTSRKASAGQFELHGVAAGGAIAVDGPTISVPARPDGRYTLLDISQSSFAVRSYLSVSNVTVPGPWAVYAGRLTVPDCSGGSSGCGEGNGVSVTSASASNFPQWGGYVLTMPADGQTTGSFSVRLTTVSPY